MATAAKHWTLRAEALPTAATPFHSFLTYRSNGVLHSVKMRVTSSGAYARPPPTPKMPQGLVELMEGLAKDVLKNNPENVFEFCAGHMQKLLEIRDGTVPKKQLSLDDKIKKAQDKIRQRIKDRQLQYQKEMPEVSNGTIVEKKEESNNPASIEAPPENTTTLKQPVLHGDELVNTSEVEIFHEPDVIITTTDNNKDNLLMKDEIKEFPPFDTDTMQDDKLVTAVDKEVKESSVDMKSDAPIIPEVHQRAVKDEVKKEKEQNEVVIEQDIPAPQEAVHSEDSTNDVIENINKKIDEIKAVPSNILKTEESELEIAVKENENMNDKNTEIFSEIKQVVIDKPEGIGVTNHENILNATQNTLLPTKSEEISTLPDSTNDNKTEESRDEEKPTVLDDQKVIENEHEEKDTIPGQHNKENSVTESVSLDIKNQETKIEEVDKDKVADQDQNSDDSKSDEHKAVVVEGKNNSNNDNNDNKTVIDESKTKIENNTEPHLESPLEILATGEDQSNVKHFEPPVVSIMSVKLVTANEALPTTAQEHSHDHVDGNVQQNDINDKLPFDEHNDKATTDEKHRHAAELFVNENNVIENNASDLRKGDIITESDEPIENAEGSGMDLETAAITIQKVFRTFLFSKSRTSTLDDTANDNSLDEEIEKKDEPDYMIATANLNKERRTLGISRMDTVLQTVNEEKSLSLSDDSSTLSSAATTIQAHVRGFLVRNRLTSYKTASNSSLVNSEGPSTKSLDGETNEPKKTILNIHIVPERGQFTSRDESMLTSIDLPLDNSPPSSINLHPLGYNKSEPRKQLKREDAIQSISPPSNNSGKLSEEVDSLKDSLELKQEENPSSLELKLEENPTISLTSGDKRQDVDAESCDTTLTISSVADTVVDAETYNAREALSSPEHNSEIDAKNEEPSTNFSSDEMDVVTPFPNAIEKSTQEIESDEKPKLVHTGEFHDIVLQTQVKRSESSVVRGE